MNISGLYSGEKLISVELRPPLLQSDHHLEVDGELVHYDDAPLSAKIDRLLAPLARLLVSYVSITNHPGSGRRHDTIESANCLQAHGYPTLVHLTGLYHRTSDIQGILSSATNSGIDNYLALRGDPPTTEQIPDSEPIREISGLDMVIQLCGLKERNKDVVVAVPCYPQGHPKDNSPEDSLRNFKDKVDLGADLAYTQMVFSAGEYGDFVEQSAALGIDIPIIPTVYFPRTVRDIEFVTGERIGVKLPEELTNLVSAHADNPRRLAREIEDYMVNITRDLLVVAPGVHLISLNQTKRTARIIEALG